MDLREEAVVTCCSDTANVCGASLIPTPGKRELLTPSARATTLAQTGVFEQQFEVQSVVFIPGDN